MIKNDVDMVETEHYSSLFKAGLQEDKAAWLTDKFVSDDYEVLSDYLA